MRLAAHGLKIGGVERPITASFGVASFPEDAADVATLMRVADRALYVAKREGRDRVETANGSINTSGLLGALLTARDDA